MSNSESESQFSFKKGERLKSTKIIQSLFDQGEYVKAYPIAIVWIKQELSTSFPAQVGFSVPKKNFKRAVDRNLIKRKVKEIYRLNKSRLYATLKEHEIQIALMIIFQGQEFVPFDVIEIKLKDALHRLSDQL